MLVGSGAGKALAHVVGGFRTLQQFHEFSGSHGSRLAGAGAPAAAARRLRDVGDPRAQRAAIHRHRPDLGDHGRAEGASCPGGEGERLQLLGERRVNRFRSSIGAGRGHRIHQDHGDDPLATIPV